MWSNRGDILHPTYYRVIVDMSNATNFPTSGTQGGGATPNPSQAGGDYSYSGGTTRPTTDAKGLLRERGNMRWERILQQLNKYTQAEIMNIDITESNGDAQGTSLGFTVKYDRDAFNREEDLASAGTYITGADCIAQLVSVGLTSTHTMKRRVYQPGTSLNEDQMMSVTATAPCSQSTALAAITVETSGTSGSGIEETAQS